MAIQLLRHDMHTHSTRMCNGAGACNNGQRVETCWSSVRLHVSVRSHTACHRRQEKCCAYPYHEVATESLSRKPTPPDKEAQDAKRGHCRSSRGQRQRGCREICARWRQGRRSLRKAACAATGNTIAFKCDSPCKAVYRRNGNWDSDRVALHHC